MPFKSEKQRRYLWANEPEIAARWTKKYGSKPKKNEKRGLKKAALRKLEEYNVRTRQP